MNALESVVKSFSKIAKSYDRDVQALRQEVALLRGGTPGARTPTEEIEAQKVALREREAEWRKIRDVGKAFKWVSENF